MLVVAGLYYIGCILAGVISNKRGAASSPQEFFVAGRGLGYFVLGFAIMATTLSAWLMLGHQGLMYASGMPYLVYYIHIPFMGIIAVMIFTRQWLLGKKFDFLSPGEMYATYYENKGMKWMVALVAILYCVPYSALQLTGAGYVFSTLTGGAIPFMWGSIIITAVVVVYVCLGGVTSTAIIDSIQGVFLVVGLVLLFVTVLSNVSAGEIIAQVKQFPKEYLTIPGGNGMWTWTYITSLALASTGIYISPAFTIWSFSAKSPKIFRWQSFVVWILIIGVIYYVVSPLIGMGGRILFPDLVKTDTLTPTIMVELMPTWMYVVVGIGLLAAMNSTAAGYLMTTGVILGNDIYKGELKPNASDKETVWAARIVVLIIVGLAFILSLTWKEHLVLMGTLATSFACQLYPSLLGILFFRNIATAKGSIWGIVVGLIVSFLTYKVWKYPLHIHCSMWGLAANLVIFFLFSLTRQLPSEETRDKFATVLEKGMQAYEKEQSTAIQQ